MRGHLDGEMSRRLALAGGWRVGTAKKEGVEGGYVCITHVTPFMHHLLKAYKKVEPGHEHTTLVFFLHAPISLSEKRKKSVGPNLTKANHVTENCNIPTCSLGGKLEGPSEVVVPVGVLAGDPGHVHSGVPQPGEGVPAPVNIPVEVHRVKLLLLPLGRVLAAELHPGKEKKKHVYLAQVSLREISAWVIIQLQKGESSIQFLEFES